MLARVLTWPPERQEQLAEIALEMEAGQADHAYYATPEELQALDEADCSGVACEEEVEATFERFRRL